MSPISGYSWGCLCQWYQARCMSYLWATGTLRGSVYWHSTNKQKTFRQKAFYIPRCLYPARVPWGWTRCSIMSHSIQSWTSHWWLGFAHIFCRQWFPSPSTFPWDPWRCNWHSSKNMETRATKDGWLFDKPRRHHSFSSTDHPWGPCSARRWHIPSTTWRSVWHMLHPYHLSSLTLICHLTWK